MIYYYQLFYILVVVVLLLMNMGRKTSDISERVSTSYDILGHPQQASKPVEEGRHYKVLAYTDWADSFIPTVIEWNHGEVDSFTDPEKSRQNQAKAIEEAD